MTFPHLSVCFVNSTEVYCCHYYCAGAWTAAPALMHNRTRGGSKSPLFAAAVLTVPSLDPLSNMIAAGYGWNELGCPLHRTAYEATKVWSPMDQLEAAEEEEAEGEGEGEGEEGPLPAVVAPRDAAAAAAVGEGVEGRQLDRGAREAAQHLGATAAADLTLGGGGGDLPRSSQAATAAQGEEGRRLDGEAGPPPLKLFVRCGLFDDKAAYWEAAAFVAGARRMGRERGSVEAGARRMGPSSSVTAWLRVKVGGHDCFGTEADDAELCAFLQTTLAGEILT